jgi:hypothetical protein
MGLGVVPLDGAAINPINLHRLSGFAYRETGVLFLDRPARREAAGGSIHYLDGTGQQSAYSGAGHAVKDTPHKWE